mmetsp:Transcript_27840/g.24638  ORF Transcript_27840/g.24638 Transcript_27840/m.24638 type:complete len:88 (+) Transcript_27840:20-283(+)
MEKEDSEKLDAKALEFDRLKETKIMDSDQFKIEKAKIYGIKGSKIEFKEPSLDDYISKLDFTKNEGPEYDIGAAPDTVIAPPGWDKK